MLSNTENILGFLALVAYIATLLPSNLKVIFPALRMSRPIKTLLKHRRAIGLSTFYLSISHAVIAVRMHDMSILERDFYGKSISGLAIMGIFTLLALTSNNWSIKRLKRNWKKLHGLTYLAAVLIPWHIVAKMKGQWTLLTKIAILLAVIGFTLFCCRKYLEMSHKT